MSEPVVTPAGESTSDGPPRAMLIAALVVAVAAIGAVLGIAATRRPPVAPVVIASVPAPKADSPTCRTLIEALPDRLGDFQRVTAAQPAPAATAAWRSGDDGVPVILRCGVDRPAEFVVGSPIQMVNGVQWFRLDDTASDRSTWVSVDRPVYVALTLPQQSGPTPIQALSDAIAHTMAAVPISPNPAR
ncbi:hypothetical protein B1R94_18630 [Mycolicibacterium litorale]|nr:hypothetical protein B1R94_18630 [Mycolicibacterium litorale]